jgi:hypothetical protein
MKFSFAMPRRVEGGAVMEVPLAARAKAAPAPKKTAVATPPKRTRAKLVANGSAAPSRTTS